MPDFQSQIKAIQRSIDEMRAVMEARLPKDYDINGGGAQPAAVFVGTKAKPTARPWYWVHETEIEDADA